MCVRAVTSAAPQPHACREPNHSEADRLEDGGEQRVVLEAVAAAARRARACPAGSPGRGGSGGRAGCRGSRTGSTSRARDAAPRGTRPSARRDRRGRSATGTRRGQAPSSSDGPAAPGRSSFSQNSHPYATSHPRPLVQAGGARSGSRNRRRAPRGGRHVAGALRTHCGAARVRSHAVATDAGPPARSPDPCSASLDVPARQQQAATTSPSSSARNHRPGSNPAPSPSTSRWRHRSSDGNT